MLTSRLLWPLDDAEQIDVTAPPESVVRFRPLANASTCYADLIFEVTVFMAPVVEIHHEAPHAPSTKKNAGVYFKLPPDSVTNDFFVMV